MLVGLICIKIAIPRKLHKILLYRLQMKTRRSVEFETYLVTSLSSPHTIMRVAVHVKGITIYYLYLYVYLHL